MLDAAPCCQHVKVYFMAILLADLFVAGPEPVTNGKQQAE
jgi:hypothetical protein